MLLDQIQNVLNSLSDYLPAITSLSPVTMAGLGVVALCSLLYFFTRVPEFLLVVLTAMLYAAAPLLR
jgi:hypothetical protein